MDNNERKRLFEGAWCYIDEVAPHLRKPIKSESNGAQDLNVKLKPSAKAQPYIDTMMPIFIEVAEHFASMEGKHCVGLAYSDDEFIKAAGHSISAQRGLRNEDGVPHGIAAIGRAFKGELGSREND